MARRIKTSRLLLFAHLVASTSLYADGQQVMDAASEIQFDLEIENASYRVKGGNRLDILFGPSLADSKYVEAIDRLRAHPDIPYVLPGRGKQDYCPVP